MSGMDFGQVDPNKQFGGGELIPHGTLAKGVITIKPYNFDANFFATPSKTPGKDGSQGWYLNVEVTITEGKHAKRKVFDRIGVAGSKAWVDAGFAAIRHILETGRGASDSNKAAYVIGGNAPPNTPIQNNPGLMELDGLPVAVRIGVEKGGLKIPNNPAGGTYEDKNTITAYLSPNPASDTHKDFARLQAGDTEPKQPAGQKPAVQGGQPAPAWAAPTAPANNNAAPPQTTTASPAPGAPIAGTGNLPWSKPTWAGGQAQAG